MKNIKIITLNDNYIIKNKDISEIITEILDHLVPDTDDKQFLNEITKNQIINATFKKNTVPRDSSDTNIIVPKFLYRKKLNQVWRYPPYIGMDFLIKKSKEPISIELKFIVGSIRFLLYMEKRMFGNNIQIRWIKNPKLDIPENFFQLKFEDDEYNLIENGYTPQKSCKPLFYQYSLNFELDLSKIGETESYEFVIPKNEIILKKIVESTKTIESILDENGKVIPNKKVDLEINEKNDRFGLIKLFSEEKRFQVIIETENDHEFPDYIRLRVKLINTQQLNFKNRIDEFKWRKYILILPTIYLTIKDVDILIPPQQYLDVLDLFLNKKSEKEGEIKNLFNINLYNGTNCIITRSVKNPKIIIGTMFGVYDTIRQMPIEGPNIEELIDNIENFYNREIFTESEIEYLNEKKRKKIIIGVLKSIEDGFKIKKLWLYQWTAIQLRLKNIIKGIKNTTIIKAPTGSGKTIVFMANAALHSILLNERSVLIFPTRILNEDMFRRLTSFIYALRKNLENDSITGGIYIGSSDPLYNSIANPEEGKPMIQYENCPNCNGTNVIAQKIGIRIIGVCEDCGHQIDYMYGSREICAYLPLITIATPDKLFYDATVSGYEMYTYRFFGGTFIRCKNCGYCYPVMGLNRKNLQCKCSINLRVDSNLLETSPIGYFVFDEVHSLYGLSGILLSIFLELIKFVQNFIKNIVSHHRSTEIIPTFETGTATISNELELLKALTRKKEEDIIIFPEDKDYYNYFEIKQNKIRYRILVLMPVAKSTRDTMSIAIMDTHMDFHENEVFKNSLKNINPDFGNTHIMTAYDFILGYLYRKRDGYTVKRAIYDQSFRIYGKRINTDFLSGDSPTSFIAKIFSKAKKNELKVLLANMVISLGIDITNLNLMIMLGLPKTTTELIQTIGRTGRGLLPGHITIHLFPTNPRDNFLYNNFHLILGDVSGYFDKAPIQSTNIYAARIIFPNILKGILSAYSYKNYVLTAPSFSYYFSNNYSLKKLLRCVFEILIPDDTPKPIKKEIIKEIINKFKFYVSEWRQLGGKGQYISEWLLSQDELLRSLREKSSQEIKINLSDAILYEMINGIQITHYDKIEFEDDYDIDESEVDIDYF
ncbi:MAG: DEAD/DEAH box helicase [Candidatus Helarchaeota archaeon]